MTNKTLPNNVQHDIVNYINDVFESSKTSVGRHGFTETFIIRTIIFAKYIIFISSYYLYEWYTDKNNLIEFIACGEKFSR